MVILIVVMISKMSIADHCIDFATCYSSHWIFTSTLLKPYSKLTNLISFSLVFIPVVCIEIMLNMF